MSTLARRNAWVSETACPKGTPLNLQIHHPLVAFWVYYSNNPDNLPILIELFKLLTLCKDRKTRLITEDLILNYRCT